MGHASAPFPLWQTSAIQGPILMWPVEQFHLPPKCRFLGERCLETVPGCARVLPQYHLALGEAGVFNYVATNVPLRFAAHGLR